MKSFNGLSAAVWAALMASNGIQDRPLRLPNFELLRFGGGHDNRIPFGSSRLSVAQDRRAAKKRRAVKRARRLGHA